MYVPIRQRYRNERFHMIFARYTPKQRIIIKPFRYFACQLYLDTFSKNRTVRDVTDETFYLSASKFRENLT